MALAKPLGIASIIGGVALLMLAFAVGTSSGTAFGQDSTPTVANGDTTGTPDAGGADTTTTPTSGAGGISTPTPVGGAGGAVTTPTVGAGGGATAPPDTGTGASTDSGDASLLWLLGAAALAVGVGAVVVGTRQRG